MKVRIIKRPLGCFSYGDRGPLQKWSDVPLDTVMDIPSVAAQDLITGEYAEKVGYAEKVLLVAKRVKAAGP